ncbi:MAG: class I SAM-dependent methyltransferase [Eubacteriales bacterium]
MDTEMKECLEQYYNMYDEDGRLLSRHGQVEYLTTMKYLHDRLKPGDRICEIGAGTGRYSVTLAGEGYDVTAVELIRYNLDILRGKISDEMHITAYEGNALDVSFLKENAFDCTLLFGPMYHLLTERERMQALRQALRVTKPGGYLFVSYCIADATIVDYIFKKGNLAHVLESGMMNTETFDLYSTPKELFVLLRKRDIDRMIAELPVRRDTYIASDGAANFMRETVDAMDDETFGWFMKWHLSICESPDVVGATHHSVDILIKERET